MMTLDDFARSKGFPEVVGLACNGEFVRFGRRGSVSSGWFKGTRVATSQGDMVIARFGDWRTGEKFSYIGDTREISAEEREKINAELAKMAEEEAHAKRKRQEEAAIECAEILAGEDNKPGGISPYLEAKGLPCQAGPYKLYVDTKSEAAKKWGPQTLVPAVDAKGKLWGLQRIGKDGFKSFKEGMKIKGCFHMLQGAPDSPVILCEGIATAISVWEALGQKVTVVSCFNAGNLKSVAQEVRYIDPNRRVIIAADNDQWTTKPGPDGQDMPWNPGFEAAQDAMKAIGGENCVAVHPPFDPEDPEHPTDWNDWHQRHGLESVAEHFRHWLHAELPKKRDAGAGVPKKKEEAPPKQEKPEAPSHQEIAERVLRTFSGTLLKQEKSLFFYNKIHWRELRVGEIDKIKQQIQDACYGKATARKIDDIFKLFMQKCPHVPQGVNLHTPPTWLANFNNGSLHVYKTQDHEGKYSLVFKPHQGPDWATNVLPYEYQDDWSETNPEFEAMLDRLFKDDPDAKGKRRALAQMFGASLLPAFPHLFMNWGGPGTGKSTVIILAAKLAHPDNCCSVDPTEWDGFNMESMVGKLVNYDTDIEVGKPITDKAIKKVIDRMPVRIKRKGIADVYGPLPATHLFGGNEIPKTLDGRSGAHTRRWTFIEYVNVIAKEDGKYDIDFVDVVWKAGYRGVLNFALKGLADLLEARGHFFQPESGKAKMKAWQLSTDVVGTFWNDLEAGEIRDQNNKISKVPGAKFERKRLYEVFCLWHEETFRRSPRVSRIAFNERIATKGLTVKVVRGVYFWEGLGCEESSGGVA